MNTISLSPNVHAAEPSRSRIPVRLAIDDRELADRIRRELASGSVFIEGDDDAALVLTQKTTVRDVPWTADRPRLSPREQEVAGLLLEGASNKVIARRLDISVHTAKFHVTQILDKLGAQNRADAVSIVLRDGLVTL